MRPSRSVQPLAPPLQRLGWLLRRQVGPGVGRVLRQHGLAIGAYLLLTLLYTRPLLQRLGEAIAGEHVPDTMQNYWNLWWTAHALLDLQQNPYHASTIQYPFGLPLFFHTFNVLNGLIALPLQICCGTIAAYNLMFLFAFALAGIGAYLLVHHLTEQRGAAFVAGLVYAFSPYMAFHLKAGQPFMVATHWFPFYLWLLLRGLRGGRTGWRWLPGAALLLLLIGLTDWHYTVYALLLTGLVGLYEAGRLRGTWRAWAGSLGLLVGKLALVGALFTVGMAPILVPMFAELAQEEYASRTLRHSIYHSTDLAAFFLPNIFHPLWGEWASDLFYGHLVEPFIAGGVASLGWVPLVLAGCAVWGAWRARGGGNGWGGPGGLGGPGLVWLFVLVFGVFFILALGPFLRVAGWQSADGPLPIPLPYLLFRQLPFMDIHRIPSRFVAVVMLALAALVGLGIQWLWQHPLLARRPAWQRGGLVVLLAGLVLGEYWPRPFGMTPAGPAEVPTFYRQISAEPADYALLEIPDLDARSMFYQTFHDKPIMGGQISRPRGHPWRRARFYEALLQVWPRWDDIGRDNSPAAVRAALRCQGVRYAIVYQQEVGEVTRRRIDRLEQALFAGAQPVDPVYADGVMRVYALEHEQPTVPYWTPHPDEWHAPELLDARGVTGRWAAGAAASLLVYPCQELQPSTEHQRALLQFDIFSHATPRTVTVLVNGAPVSNFAVPLGWVRRVGLVLRLQPGVNRIELRSAQPATPETIAGPPARPAAGPRTLSFNLSRVSLETYPER